MSRFKACKKEELTDDPNEAAFSIAYNEDMSEIVLSLQANRRLSPEEYVKSLAAFVRQVKKNPHELFSDDVPPVH